MLTGQRVGCRDARVNGSNQCKGPEGDRMLVCLGKSKVANVPGVK